ncbi:DUF2986 domain-containing protein [Aliagarivorans taiwanensis]|uniref:DUF2986 domain-containing protein n=1 Tax=Aliagarivorans taiwanensis TaxID=561966 RepID=UPI00040BF3C5|nr:DUF2986 domain-containing protein [Aliagarivorans taiwanensis]
MNRKKKIIQTLKKKAKKANAKKHGAGSSKPRYISKAERAAQQAEGTDTTATAEQPDPQTPSEDEATSS